MLSRLLPRIAILLVAAVLTVLIGEGALSLFLGRSLRPRPLLDFAEALAAGAEEAQKSSTGTYRSHVDPRIGYVFRPGTHRILDREFRVGPRGTRIRPGEIPPNAVRIAVVGDSVAFGVGLADDETIAARIEVHLNEVRGPSAPRVVAETVAVPGWNLRNSTSFLEENLSSYDPDVVVAIPIGNDTADTFSPDASGRTRLSHDPAAEDPLLVVGTEMVHAFVLALADRVRRGDAPDAVSMYELGATALTSDLSRESNRRHDDNARLLLRLDDVLRARDGRLLVAWLEGDSESDKGHAYFVRERLVRDRPELACVVLLHQMRPEFGLERDPHPNAACADACARWIVDELLERGFVARGEDRPRPPVGAPFAAARAAARTPAQVTAGAAARRERFQAMLQSSIEPSTGRGCTQVYGGLNPDGTIGARLLAMLPRPCREIEVELAPLGSRHAAAIDVAVEIDGTFVGTMHVPGRARATFAVPAEGGGSPCIEVRLVPSSWTVARVMGHELLVACRLVSLTARL